jgi:DNA modification methylase
MGVGSTGVAAVELGRRFVGIELEPAYVEAARRRLTDVAGTIDGGGAIGVSR